MRPMFSVEKVGIDAGGSALAVTARLPDWPPTLMPTSSAMTAVRRTALAVRVVIDSPLNLRPQILLLRGGRRVGRPITRFERGAVGQGRPPDAANRRAVVHRLDDDGHLVAALEGISRPAALRHPGGVLRLERPVAHSAGVVHGVDLEEAMRVRP